MEFEQQPQAELYARVDSYLRQAFGELAELIEDEPAFALSLDRVHMIVKVNANGPEMASVLTYTLVATGLPITLELTTLLLQRNHVSPFGILGLFDNRIWLHHVLLGEMVTKDGLAMLLEILADYAMQTEDELNARFR